MKLYIKGTRKWVKIRARSFDGARYLDDFSNDILFNYQDCGDYTKSQISKALRYCEKCCKEFGFKLFVEDGED